MQVVVFCKITFSRNRHEKFPNDRVRKEIWSRIIGKQRKEPYFNPRKNTRVCSVHFSDNDFGISKAGLRRLKESAMPRFENEVMALVEIDPELFIKCRLCIEDNGSYQITPTLLKNIKFCFDIKIELFDGLSQVLCKSCKERLEYFECLKRTVQENQNVINLKRKDSSKNEVQIKPPKLVESSEDVTSTQTQERQKELEQHGDTEETNCRSWKDNFKICFVCRYCGKPCNTKQILFDHMNSHVDFRRFCRNTLKKHCKVALNRVDALPNLTGASNKIVVYDSSTLIQDKNCIDYYVTYFPKKTIQSNINETECKGKKIKRKKWRISSDDESDVKQLTLRKRIRLMSGSSSSNNDHEDSAIMNISDDPDQDDAKSHVVFPDRVSDAETVAASAKELDNCVTPVDLPQFDYTDDVKKIVDLNSIRSSVQWSYKRFMRPYKSDTSNSDRELMLRRKVLSIGRKVMSKCGIPSNGLLNYCEYNDLPLSVKFHNRLVSDESQYVRVLTKVKDFDKDNSLIGFEKVPKILLNGNETLQEQSVNGIKTYNNVNKHVQSDIAAIEAVLSRLPDKEQMVQLLNKTPVANPKKIQKKKLSNVTNTPNSFISLIDSDEEEPNHAMPVITATTSLATENENEKEKVTSSTLTDTNTNSSLPRIKCKPVTQLMSNTALCNLTEQVNKVTKPLAPNNSGPLLNNNYGSLTLKDILQSDSRLPPWKAPQTMAMLNSGPPLIPNSAMVVLETDEHNSPLPITKTKFPLDCLKTLLNNNSLNLIDSKTEHTEQYSTLAKYGLEMRSNNASQQISVIFKVYINNFCLKSQFANGSPIDLEKLTPAWQWEILKSLCDYQLSCTIMLLAESLGSEIYRNSLLFYKVLFSIEKF